MISTCQKNKVIGVMSGTSGDGLDIATCWFQESGEGWQYQIEHAETLPYPPEWQKRLEHLDKLSGRELWETHVQFGHFMGKAIQHHLRGRETSITLVASHGHTVFHRPDLAYSMQMGDGAALAAILQVPVVCDFRSGDVAKGGQGAPLVPIGDALLFSHYTACINLGGYGNISYKHQDNRVAYDICPVNRALNYYANKFGLPYDPEGKYARQGHLIASLLEDMNQIAHYHLRGPRSIGQEWFMESFMPVIMACTAPTQDMLHTLCEHIAIQISLALAEVSDGRVLVTGGGVHNTYLMERIRHHCGDRIEVPDALLVDYKEAMIFAFLGLLRVQGRINCLASVSGAYADSRAGAVYLP